MLCLCRGCRPSNQIGTRPGLSATDAILTSRRRAVKIPSRTDDYVAAKAVSRRRPQIMTCKTYPCDFTHSLVLHGHTHTQSSHSPERTVTRPRLLSSESVPPVYVMIIIIIIYYYAHGPSPPPRTPHTGTTYVLYEVHQYTTCVYRVLSTEPTKVLFVYHTRGTL